MTSLPPILTSRRNVNPYKLFNGLVCIKALDYALFSNRRYKRLRLIVEVTSRCPDKDFIRKQVNPLHLIIRQKSQGSEIDLESDKVHLALGEIFSKYFITGWRIVNLQNPENKCSDAPNQLACLLRAIRPYLERERYWEAHEVLEAQWKVAVGKRKKEIQVLVLLCVSMIKEQMGQHEVGIEVYNRAIKIIEELKSTELRALNLPFEFSYPLRLHIS